MPLSKLHIVNVCQLGTNQECRYLEEDTLEDGVFNCLKLSSQKKTVDKITETNKKDRKYGGDTKTGDNCKGYPVFRHKICGYDQKDG